MPALGYKKQFVPVLKSGLKRHSIRAQRRRPFKVGDTLMHYYGMRTKQCRKIRKDTVCVGAIFIEINAELGWVWTREKSFYYSAGRFSPKELHDLAICDGFESVEDFFTFFRSTHGEKFIGQLIEWQP